MDDHVIRRGPLTRVDLALSGCGALGPAHVGVLHALRSAQVQIPRVAGTSAGSLVAAGLACGLPTSQMARIAEMVLAGGDILDERAFPFLRSGWGVCAGDRLHSLIRDHLGSGKTLGETKIPLAIVVTDVEAGAPLVLRSDTHPDVLIADAVAASCSIPFVFSARRIAGLPGWYVDGGVTANVPGRAWPTVSPGCVSLVVRVGSRTPRRQVTGPLSFARAIVGAVMGNADWRLVDAVDEVVDVVVDGDALDFKASDHEVAALHDAGHDAIVEWLRDRITGGR